MLDSWHKPSDKVVRNLAKVFYLSEACFAAIVLGIVSWFLSHYEDTPVYPAARLIWTEIIAALAILYCATLVFTFDYYPACFAMINMFFALAFFASFGAVENFDCDDNWMGWRSEYGEPYRPCWRATAAFTFLSGFFWLVSVLLAYWTPINKEPHHILPRKPSHGSSTIASEQV
ncbi:hypothetical protein HRR83_001202 [Exophiala dermatitidis]|uniref:MARVEL domain-containing protein n=2 Tax=Exophiala dermatitidis TaxID=5970 RepID=H6C724_EXODN|nr:uncharacterized protein HMPREF1120_07508 [Exophiala dermatitidis NIH/UT8656]KAJ4522712.1 hypothetical protein HRR75_001106 [Exophiala dermatitidis]EHY59520.1 hypothetical protein HMPREF1120_07508 [Exophiala dermatitidis NIH/UT8656]KAJ4526013.1 hypothetical protein HRR74_001206 [Exophiala dermatitidis]KAJ4527041.1 hypothetical protein HRR73_001838 [Exophiala dermatitidis]KAJ4532759.1 hypothetical protein HRR76_007740 [Exophiala dermatitidis]